MKKILSLALALIVSAVLGACGAAEPSQQASSAAASSATSAVNPMEGFDPIKAEKAAGQSGSTSDDRGISGMNSYAIQTVLSGDPFNVPYTAGSPSGDQNYCATSCVSNSEDNGAGITYDYSLSLDNDNDIVSASFSISATSANADQLLSAADLYFYAISLIKYDTADTDTLGTWFSDNLKSANSNAIATTIGDATYELYGTPGSMYWVDISKAAK